MRTYRTYLGTGLLVLAATLSAGAGTVSIDFNSGGLPAGTHTNSNVSSGGSGGAYLELTGGIGDSGCLKITKNLNSQNGSFILDDLDAGNPIYGFDATFKLRIGGGGSTPADGMAFCVAPDFTDTSIWGETGAGSGVRFCWATYPFSNQAQPDPAVKVRVGGGGTIVAYKGYTVDGLSTGGTDPSTWWADVHIRLNADGSLNMDYKGVNLFTNFFIPGYQAFADAAVPMRFGFGGRTGGANDNFWVDNLQITTFTQPKVGFSQQAFNQTAQQGDNIDFDVRITNPTGVTLQWYSNNVAIAGATGQTLTLSNLQAAASGSKYKVTAIGPNNAVTNEVTLTVTNLTLPATPQLSFNFNDGATPAAVTLTGTAVVDTSGGVANSACVKLVNPSGSAAMLVADPAPTAPLYGFTARFKMLVGGGTVPPADGFAFGFGTDIPDAPAGDFETGAGLGTGLRVTFDIYDNDGILGFISAEDTLAPSIDVRYGNQILGTAHLPISFMESGLNPDSTPAYTDVIIQLNADATLNVVYHGDLVFDHLPVTAFGSFGPGTNTTGSRFAVAARTGGLNDNIWLDNFELTTVTTPGTLRFTTQPVNRTVPVNYPVTFSAAVNNSAGVTYQWLRGGTAISGATDSSYTLPTALLADSGATFKVQATQGATQITSDQVTLTVANITPPPTPVISYNFNDGLVPAGTTVYGSAAVAPSGGVGGSGVLQLTLNQNSLSGAFVAPPAFGGAQVSALWVSYDVHISEGSGRPADGMSFSFAPDAVSGTASGPDGSGTGLTIGFDTYDNGAGELPFPAPSIDVHYKGAIVASTHLNYSDIDTGPGFRTMVVRVDTTGKLDLTYGDRVLYQGLQLPNWTFVANPKFAFYAATGGENENHWLDNILLQPTKSSGPLTIVTEPADALAITGGSATYSVVVSDPVGATYQWSKGSTAISGATQSSYTTPATTLADNGATFTVKATGPSGTATSRAALLTVVAPITVSNPIMTYNFNDCQLPPDTILTGPAYINCSGGVADSGVLHLTDNVNGQQGSFIMPDFNAGATVKAIAVSFNVRIADGTGTPADGISFSWGSSNSIANNANFGEGGAGDGVSVGLITYAGRVDGPSFNVWYRGNRLVNMLVPYSALTTADLSTDPLLQYATLAFRVNENGTLDLQYKGKAILNALPLPGYTPITDGRFAMGARTGGENETHWVDNIAIATTVGQVSVPIGFSHTGNQLTLTWPTGWKLQSTASLSPANWQDVAAATSPYQVSTSTGMHFYRLAPAP